MQVYHFFNEQYGLQAIRDGQLKVGRINELNDPFELFYLNTDNYVTHEIINGRKNKANRIYGVICFSKNYSSPVQWAHYADSHKGVCLGFDIPERKLIKIEYLEQRGTHNEFLSALDLRGEDFIRYLLSKKYKHWLYEQEYRLLVEFGKIKEDNSLVFMKFSDELKLTEVIIGFRSTLNKKFIKKIFFDRRSEIIISKVIPSKTKYEMENAN